MVNTARLNGETEQHYVLRICMEKDAIGDWNDVADILNKELGHDWDASAYRKPFQYIMSYLPHSKDLFGINENASAIDELRNERLKIQAEKVELNRLLRQYSRFDLFYENIKGAIERLVPPAFSPCCNDACHDRSYVVAFGDLHMGSEFESMHNEYNMDICKDRMAMLLCKTIDFVERNQCVKITVANLGDSIQGMIHMTDISLNETSVIDSVVQVSRLIAQFLNELSAHCYVDYIHVPSANHAENRPLGTKASVLIGEDMEKLIIEYVGDLLAENNRVFIYGDPADNFVAKRIAGLDVCFIHGHQIKSIENSLSDLSRASEIDFDYVIMGHYHSLRETTVGEYLGYNREIIVVPSIVGSDPYSDKIMKSSKSEALILGFDENHGHVSTEHVILN